MHAAFNKGGQSNTITVFDVDARFGRDWHLTIQASKAATVHVFALWAGGKRQLSETALAADTPVDIELPQRVAGERLRVTCKLAQPGAAVAASLSWTPDPTVEAPCSCSC